MSAELYLAYCLHHKHTYMFINLSLQYLSFAVPSHHLFFRECVGPIIGGALLYKVGFQTMTSVSPIDNDTSIQSLCNRFVLCIPYLCDRTPLLIRRCSQIVAALD